HADPKVPIGRPIDNTQIYLLDKDLNEVAIGETGEIYIGGDSVARGYLNRPQLTKERFINNPFTNKKLDRIYKSGDLARMLPDGNIDFIGRDDYQIKLRGYRIELGEIEAQILKHPSIRETVVTVVGENSTDKKLVAYIVFVNDKSLTVSELRTYLAKQLAEYMIPAAYVVLDKMPLATSGKIDRKALPSLGKDRPDLEQAYVAPSTDIEKYIAKLWCEILDLNRIGIYDKFFELGGNSLQAAQFISQLQKELKTNIFIVTIFEAPSIAEYVDLLKRDYAKALQNRFEKITSRNNQINITTNLQQSDFDNFDQYVPQLISEKASPKKRAASLQGTKGRAQAKNKKAIFILAPPRSGTTLLRVMLAGHPDLFAANELQLLGFQTMKARKEAYTGKFSLWLEGAVRTVMELKNCDADEAKNIIHQFELNNKTTKAFYKELQNWIGEKILVDKSPSYALDYHILQKAEQDFEDAIYIQLVRHPYAMIRSFEKMHMDQVMYLHAHQYNARQTGELIWTKSHQNINRFLQQIPAHRQFRLSYEDLVRQPKQMMQALCEKLGLDFHPALVNPYEDIEQKMTDGLYEHSKPMGDPKLLQHQKIDPKLADAWKGVLTDNFLSKTTWQLATDFSYPNIKNVKGAAEQPNENLTNSNSTHSTDIAIIGMSGRFPGAKNLQEFWQNLEEGKDVSKVFTTEELLKEGVDSQLFNSPDYVNRGMPLAHADCFDASFFGYLPKEAALMDPQHRIFLELAYAALEDAAYDPSRFKGEIGVFGGIARNTYLINNVLTHPNYFKSLDDFQIGVGLEKDFPATKVAYKLKLNGPAVNVQTACSSSGVAVHLACQSLLLGDAD
ncbi:MAG TPA: hypothetical protein ENK52_01770, partial [Saprospiraceae bacterium]|nr:hypothetical protein [Saprospiraceae bacterium]